MTSRPRRSRFVSIVSLVPVLGLAVTVPGEESAHAQDTRPAERPLQVGLLVLDGVYNSELIAPMDIFHHTRFHVDPGMAVFTVGRSRGLATSFEGLRIAVDHDLESAPPIDVLVVPSAEHSMDSDLEDERLIAWVRERGKTSQYVLSVCDGAFVLAEAGLLDGRFCTTFPGDIPSFRERFPELDVVEGVTFVRDGPAITGVGGARSFAPALHLVEHLYGRKVARGVARGMVLDWDDEKQRRLVLPERTADAPVPRCYLPGQRLGRGVEVEDDAGRRQTLHDLVDDHAKTKVVVLCIFGGAEAEAVANRGGLWCEDSFNELPNLRHLRLRYEDRGVLFLGVACPPVYHEERFGFDAGAFLERPESDPVYGRNRDRFAAATRRLERAGMLSFHVTAFDPRFRLLGQTPAADPPAEWRGRFRWFEDTQTYGTPTIWVLSRDLEVLGPPFIMNVYESEGRKLRYTPDDVGRLIDIGLAK